MKLGALLYNEWRFYRVQPLFWLAPLLAVAFAVLATVGNGLQTAQPHKELLFTHTKLLMMLQPLLIGALAPLAFLRDRQFGMQELTGVTPLNHRQWCVSRAGGLLLLVLAVKVLLLLLAATAVWFGIDRQAVTVTVESLGWISMQLFLLLLGSLTMDGGQLGMWVIYSIAIYWIMAVIIIARRSRNSVTGAVISNCTTRWMRCRNG